MTRPFNLAARLAALSVAAALSPAVQALTQPELQALIQQRFEGDRTGACVVAAVIEKDRVLRARHCAAPRKDGEPDFQPAFEIGSITKTMTAFLVADLIQQGRWSLDDPIAQHLPKGTSVPAQGERQILLRDILAHRSGLPALPPGFRPRDMADPYADLSEDKLLAALSRTQLNRPIGSQFEYSNFAMMLVSLAVSQAYGRSYEAALQSQLFEPLGMKQAFITQPAPGVSVATGHLSSGVPTSAWHHAVNLAGVGMVRASLDDMVRYAQAQLGLDKPGLDPRMALTQQPLQSYSGMNWMLSNQDGHALVAHGGGTGGFSSYLLMEPRAQRAVVLLADASQPAPGGLDPLAHALLGLDPAPQRPRLATEVPAALRAAMPGDYELGGMRARVWLDGDKLMTQAQGQSAFELRYDSHGDFYPQDFSAMFTPELRDGQVVGGWWSQGGGQVPVRRLDTPTPAKAPEAATRALWKEWAGAYALHPQFTLKVFEQDGRLQVQGSGQPAIEAEVTGPDRIEVKAVGAVLEFKRNAQGEVDRAVLKQNGGTLEGKRQPG